MTQPGDDDNVCKDHQESKSPRRKFLTIPEAAEELNIGERSVWRLIKDGKLPTYHFGDSTRIKREDLDAYVERCRKLRNQRHSGRKK